MKEESGVALRAYGGIEIAEGAAVSIECNSKYGQAVVTASSGSQQYGKLDVAGELNVTMTNENPLGSTACLGGDIEITGKVSITGGTNAVSSATHSITIGKGAEVKITECMIGFSSPVTIYDSLLEVSTSLRAFNSTVTSMLTDKFGMHAGESADAAAPFRTPNGAFEWNAWGKKYTKIGEAVLVSFQRNIGDPIPDQLILKDSKIKKPDVPDKIGNYTLAGWYKNREHTVPWDFGSDTVSQDTTIYGHWKGNTYKVTLEANDGVINSGNVTSFTYGERTFLPTADNMTRTGYRFMGWYRDNDFTGDSVQSLIYETSDLILYAKWEAITYHVTLNAGNGTIANGKDVTCYTYGKGATLPTADDMIHTGYVFDGWYDNDRFTGPSVTEIRSDDTDDKTFYAKWLSTDAGVTELSIDNVAGVVDGATITVVLPYGTVSLPTDRSMVSITTAAGAQFSTPVMADNGGTWTFSVTAEDKRTSKDYTVKVSIAENPAAGNAADLDAAEYVIKNHGWTVEQATANTEEAVKAWIEEQLAERNLNGADYTVSITGGSFKSAVEGDAHDRDGTDGGFSFAVNLFKGIDTGNIATSTYAEKTVAISGGLITATPYQAKSYTIAVSAAPAAGGTVNGGGVSF